MRKTIILICLSLSTSLARAQVPPTPTECKFPIDTPHFSLAHQPSVISSDDGGFFAVYVLRNLSATQGSDFEQAILGRRVASTGDYLGDDITIGDFVPAILANPRIERDVNGDFVVGWSRSELESNDTSVHGRHVDSDGTLRGNDFQVNSNTAGFHRHLDLATSGSNVLYVWNSNSLDDDGGIVGRLSDLDGHFTGPEMALNAYTTGEQSEPAIEVTPDGDFIVAWRGPGVGPGTGDGVFIRPFASDGTSLGTETRINSSQGFHTSPQLAHDTDDFLVVWNYRAQGDPFRSINGQFVNEQLAPQGPERLIFADRDAFANNPRIASPSVGEFVVVWSEYLPTVGYEYGASGVLGRTLSTSDSDPVFRVDGIGVFSCLGCAHTPDVAASTIGQDFMVVWGDTVSPISRYGVLGQRFDGPVGVLSDDLALNITEVEDPTEAQTGFRYIIEVDNRAPCIAEGVQLEITMPPQAVAEGFSVVGKPNFLDCDVGVQNVTCSGALTQGLRDETEIFVRPLPNSNDLLISSGEVSSDRNDLEPLDNTDIETTEVLRCIDLTRSHTGKGQDPVTDLEASTPSPCSVGSHPPGAIVALIASADTDGWRLASWSGTDDDASTSRFNTVTMGANNQEVVAHYIFEGTISWWTGDEELIDIAGPNDLIATDTANLFNAFGEQGSAFSLDTDPLVEAPPHPSLNLGNTFSIGFWVQVGNGNIPVRALVDHRIQGANADLGYFAYLADGRPAFRLGDGQAAADYISSRDIEDDLFHLVVYTFDRGLLRIFIDGILDAEHDTSAIGDHANFGRLTLGSQSIGPPEPLFGRLDEIFLADQAIDTEQITQIFQRPLNHWSGDGNTLDSTQFASHGVLAGGAGYAAGQCDLGFDLSSPGANMTAPPVEGVTVTVDEFTFAAWIRAGETSDLQEIFSREGPEAQARLTLHNGWLRLQAGSSFSVFSRFATELGDLRDGLLHFIAVSSQRSSGGIATWKFYLDDAVNTFNVPSGSSGEIGDADLVLGGPQGGPTVLDEVLFFDRVLTQDRLLAIRQQCLQPLFVDGFESGDTSEWSTAVP